LAGERVFRVFAGKKPHYSRGPAPPPPHKPGGCGGGAKIFFFAHLCPFQPKPTPTPSLFCPKIIFWGRPLLAPPIASWGAKFFPYTGPSQRGGPPPPKGGPGPNNFFLSPPVLLLGPPLKPDRAVMIPPVYPWPLAPPVTPQVPRKRSPGPEKECCMLPPSRDAHGFPNPLKNDKSAGGIQISVLS